MGCLLAGTEEDVMLDVNKTRSGSGLARGEWQLLLVLAAIQFTHLVDFMIVLPLGPHFIRILKITPQAFGIMVSAYGFSAVFPACSPWQLRGPFRSQACVAGALRRVCRWHAPLCRGRQLLGAFARRVVTGGFGGVVAALVLAVVGDAFPYSRRGMAMGVVMSAFSVALITGVPLGLYLANAFGWATPFAVLGGLSVLVLIMATFTLPPLQGHLDKANAGERIGFWQILFHPNHLRAYALMLALVFGVFMIVPYIATYLVANVGCSEADLPYVYLSGGLRRWSL